MTSVAVALIQTRSNKRTTQLHKPLGASHVAQWQLYDPAVTVDALL